LFRISAGILKNPGVAYADVVPWLTVSSALKSIAVSVLERQLDVNIDKWLVVNVVDVLRAETCETGRLLLTERWIGRIGGSEKKKKKEKKF